MTQPTCYNLVLETRLKSGRVQRDVVHTAYDQAFAAKLAGNLNASIRAARHAAQLTIDTKVVIEPDVLQ